MEHFILALDLLGTFTFAVAGTIAALRKKLDLFGALFTATLTAVGGGTLRDLLIGQIPPAWMQTEVYLIVILAGTLLALFLRKAIHKIKKPLLFFDAIGIGVFTVIGTQKALAAGLSPVFCALMGFITAVMGGVLRDTFVNEIPLILKKEIYATACFIGGLLYVLLLKLGMGDVLTTVLSMAFVIGIRLLSVRFGLSLPVLHSKAEDSSKQQ